MRAIKLKLFWTLVLALALLLGAVPAAAQESLEGYRARYALEAKISASRAGQMIGSWPVEGEFCLAFRRRNEDGLQEVELSLDRLAAPGVPGLDEALDGFVGQKATLVFDERGRLVDLDLALPEEMLEELRSRLNAIPQTATSGEARPTLVEALRELRRGTLITFSIVMPREQREGKDEVAVEVEFAGPDEHRDVYVVLTRLSFDLAGTAIGATDKNKAAKAEVRSDVQAKLRGRTEFSLENGLLSLLDLEMAVAVVPPEESPLDVGVKFTVSLAEITPLTEAASPSEVPSPAPESHRREP
ncbi:MAG: hypothetical protein QME79_05400 [Bacillota bacterium]|nr:hypothetical protein [Bacillota bacterium]